MVTIKAFRERQYYHSKFGEKLFIDSKDGDVALKAALLSGRGLKTEEELVYTSAGRTLREAQNSLDNYLKAIGFPYAISRKEIRE